MPVNNRRGGFSRNSIVSGSGGTVNNPSQGYGPSTGVSGMQGNGNSGGIGNPGGSPISPPPFTNQPPMAPPPFTNQPPLATPPPFTNQPPMVPPPNRGGGQGNGSSGGTGRGTLADFLQPPSNNSPYGPSQPPGTFTNKLPMQQYPQFPNNRGF